MHQRAARLFRGAARRARTRTYPGRTTRVARLLRYPDGPDRLVASPVFVLSSMRSGSAVLRRLLDNHSRICAPPEMHLSMWRVETRSKVAQAALDTMGMTPQDLADLLWDRMLHLQLVRSGKSVVVDQTPRNALVWKRIAAAWPRARFLVLMRHPVRVAESLVAAHPEIPAEVHHAQIERYALALYDAQRHASSTLAVRYEDLVTDPAATTRRVAEWLNVPWEESMASLGRNAPLTAQLSPQPDPDHTEIDPRLRKACELLGYV